MALTQSSRSRGLQFLFALAALVSSQNAFASIAPPLPAWSYVEGGLADEHGSTAAAGVAWSLPWKWSKSHRRVETHLEMQISQWSLDSGHGRWRSLQLIVVPLARHTWQSGPLAPIFIEGGIGVSYFFDDLHTTSKTMATRWNFHDVVAVGVQLGALRQHELSIRAIHQSNAGLREPNPGINAVQIRWALAL